MSDTVTPRKRSEIMRCVKSANTTPEKMVKYILRKLGVKYRMSTQLELPGHPDVVLPARKLVIFVHGCFWHQHSCPRGNRRPSSRTEYWNAKLDQNIRRDRRVKKALRKKGWRVGVVWECETRNLDKLRKKILSILAKAEASNTTK